MQSLPLKTTLAFLGLSLAGCGATSDLFAKKGQAEAVFEITVDPSELRPRPKPRPDFKVADIEDVKTVTEEEIAEAKAKPTGGAEKLLGTTIVALGLLDRDGLWLRTPLAKAEVSGRVVYSKTGKAANVTLLPLKGDKGAGSQLSLAAMQVLGIPFAGLAEVKVFTN